MIRGWIVVAAAAHVQHGRAGGFVQAGHGKEAPLRRMRPGDVVICYSPTRVLGGGDRVQAFTAIGIVSEGEPYRTAMGADFHPFRRCVAWLEAAEAPIQPLLERLEFTKGRRNWGYQLRFGLFAVSARDVRAIAKAMLAVLPA